MLGVLSHSCLRGGLHPASSPGVHESIYVGVGIRRAFWAASLFKPESLYFLSCIKLGLYMRFLLKILFVILKKRKRKSAHHSISCLISLSKTSPGLNGLWV